MHRKGDKQISQTDPQVKCSQVPDEDELAEFRRMRD